VGADVRSAATVAVLLGLTLGLQAHAGVLPEVADQLKKDGIALVTVDQPPTASQLAIGLGIFALAVAADSRLVVEGREHVPGWIDTFKTGGAAGSANTIAASLIAGGLVFGDHRVTTGGLTLLEGNILLGVVVPLAKRAFGRVRPNQPNAGQWFAGGDSFPSDHAAHAFLVASVLDATIDRTAWRWVLYPLATGVALERVHEGVHFSTDVLAGGLLGWWVGHRLSVSHGLVERPHRVAFSFVPLPGGALAVAHASF
jgi:membrane-associated phospholipid phosphatase